MTLNTQQQYSFFNFKKNIHYFLQLLMAFYLLLMSSAAFALAFNVAPQAGTPLPTTFVPGVTLNAYYTVTNNTTSQLNNNYVKYLPPNVTQVSNTCGSTFNLAPSQSCILQLMITGTVNGADPDPHHHLFVCLSGGLTCAGTLYPLNVKELTLISVTPANTSVPLGDTQQYTATATYSDNSTGVITNSVSWSSSNPTVATVSATGLASSQTVGTTAIVATFGSISGSATLTVGNKVLRSIAVTPANSTLVTGNTLQYTATGTYSDNTTADLTNSVIWSSSNASIASISGAGLATGNSPGFVTFTARLGTVSGSTNLSVIAKALVSISITPTSTTRFANQTQQYTATGHYNDSSTADITSSVTWASSNTSIATIVPSSGLATAHAVGSTNITATLGAITSNSATFTVNSLAFLTVGSDLAIYSCTVNSAGIFGSSNCGNSVSFITPDYPYAVAVNPARTRVYITVDPNIVACTFNQSGEFSICTVVNAAPIPSGLISITINPAGTFAYPTTTETDGVYYCPINSNGTLGVCAKTGSGFNSTYGMNFNAAGTTAYVVNFDTATISYCSIALNGTLNSCANANATGLTGPTNIVINPAGTFAYIADQTANRIVYCAIQSNGSFSSCTTLPTVFSQPTFITLNPTGTTLYVTNASSGTVSICPVLSDGSVGACTNDGGFIGLGGISVI